jgi:hypothetical protein
MLAKSRNTCGLLRENVFVDKLYYVNILLKKKNFFLCMFFNEGLVETKPCYAHLLDMLLEECTQGSGRKT